MEYSDHGRVGKVNAVLMPPNPPPRMTMCGCFDPFSSPALLPVEWSTWCVIIMVRLPDFVEDFTLVGANAVATEKADKSTSKMNGSNMLQLIIQIDSLRRHGRPAVIAAFASMKVPDRTLSRKSRRFCFFERGMLSNSVSHTHRHVVILFPFIFSLSASIFVTHSLCAAIDLPAFSKPAGNKK